MMQRYSNNNNNNNNNDTSFINVSKPLAYNVHQLGTPSYDCV